MSSMQRTRRAETMADLRDAASLSSAMGLVGMSYGALAPTAGLSPLMTIALSVLVFAGGAQLLILGVLVAGGGIWPAIIAGLVLNLRNVPFALVLAPFVRSGWRVVPAAYGVTDGTTAFVLSRTEGTPGRPQRAFWIFGIVQFSCWQLGTVLGLLLSTAIPDGNTFGLDAAFPAALLAMLVALLRKSDARRVAVTSAAISLAATPFLPVGIPVLAALLGVGAAGRPRSGNRGRWPGGTSPSGPRTPETGIEQPRSTEAALKKSANEKRDADETGIHELSTDQTSTDAGRTA